MTDETKEIVKLHHRVLFGDPENIKEQPGLLADHAIMSIKQERTNEILMEVRNALLWVVGIIMTGFVTAVLALVYRGTV